MLVPDSRGKVVPYSSTLRKWYRDVRFRLSFDINRDGSELRVLIEDNTPANIEHFLRTGAQFSRLYQENKRILESCGTDREFFGRVRACYSRFESEHHID